MALISGLDHSSGMPGAIDGCPDRSADALPENGQALLHQQSLGAAIGCEADPGDLPQGKAVRRQGRKRDGEIVGMMLVVSSKNSRRRPYFTPDPTSDQPLAALPDAAVGWTGKIYDDQTSPGR